jgi:4-hydroxy-4-methyl-2-oxoglutarate aldolase
MACGNSAERNRTSEHMTDPFTQRLARLDCCAVSDALDKLNLTGVVTVLPQRSSTRRIAGRAITVKLVAKDQAPATGGPPRHLGTTAIESGGPGNVIVVEQRSGIEAGSWGGILSLAAKVRGIEGVVADGPVRDIDEARAYDLPIYSRGLTARTARGRVAEAATNVDVRIDDVTVSPGDYVLADNSGVIFIRAADIEKVVAAAEEIVAREAAMAKALLAGQPVGTVMGANYENMLTVNA